MFSRCLQYELVRRDAEDRKNSSELEMQPIVRKGPQRRPRRIEQEQELGDEEEGKPVPVSILKDRWNQGSEIKVHLERIKTN